MGPIKDAHCKKKNLNLQGTPNKIMWNAVSMLCKAYNTSSPLISFSWPPTQILFKIHLLHK
jgi:hypothetical protein